MLLYWCKPYSSVVQSEACVLFDLPMMRPPPRAPPEGVPGLPGGSPKTSPKSSPKSSPGHRLEISFGRFGPPRGAPPGAPAKTLKTMLLLCVFKLFSKFQLQKLVSGEVLGPSTKHCFWHQKMYFLEFKNSENYLFKEAF